MGLLRYTLYRLLQAIPVLIGITIITFLLANLAPGDPVRLMLQGQEVDEELIETIEQRYGLDQPLHERYITYMSGLVQGDFGHSIHRNQPVSDLMLSRLGPTLLLVLSAYAFAIATAIPLGIFAATRRNDPADHISRIVALIGVSTPSFWIGIMLILLFAVQLGWLPSSGLVYPWWGPEAYDWIDTWPELLYQTARHLLLPMVALGTLQMATLMRVERTQMIESLQGEYVKLARAYGVPERTILRKHAFQVAQLPIITIIGLNLSTALGGAVLIEYVFNINGMGRLFIEAIQSLDYQLIMGITIVIGTMFVIGVIITDISYAYIDPRVTYGEEE
ncbi:binding-protein-dependent transporters inner membrane component [Natronococcus amylolyticus DSM 10524]|uniref:Binding-protein-dependent transporters inner membrane component n=1 Tax=Natronococcus amylolyticus DSM 10524 TaxID=1227497 RepID=L9XBQ1_9EURY|nr:ABC transporter permease [Natronococcus amylolyticus]ELY59160.1 binding-protein-dependent transporters inner membrane component [Natronococcus amylolyticus DSM 10524]